MDTTRTNVNNNKKNAKNRNIANTMKKKTNYFEVKSDSKQNATRSIAIPHTKSRHIESTTSEIPTRTSPRNIRKSTSTRSTYPHSKGFKNHYINNIPILQTTVRFEEDEYDVWRRIDTNEVNLYYMMRLRYPTDEEENEWKLELEKLKKEISEYRIVEDGYFHGIWIPLDTGRNIAKRYEIYDHVSILFELKDLWYVSPDKRPNLQKCYDDSYKKPKRKIAIRPSTTSKSISNSDNNDNVDFYNSSSPVNNKGKKIQQRRSINRNHDVSRFSRKNLRENITIIDANINNGIKRKLEESDDFYSIRTKSKQHVIWAVTGAVIGITAAVVLKELGI